MYTNIKAGYRKTTWVDPEGGGTEGPDPPENSQKDRVF